MTLSLHSHTVYSQRDAIIKADEAAAKIKANGGTHYAISDHGTIQGWLSLRDACKDEGLVPVYGCELYVSDILALTLAVKQAREQAPAKLKTQVTVETFEREGPRLADPDLFMAMKAFVDEKEAVGDKSRRILSRLNYGYSHLVATAVTPEGRRNLIRLHNRGWTDGFFVKPQVTTQDCLELADGIIWTSACLGGPLANRLRIDPTGASAARYLQRWEHIKDRFFLEVQPLDSLDQRIYNQQLINLHHHTGFPLILSQDNHHLEEDDWIAHRILMLAQNDQPISRLEAVYEYAGQQMHFSDLKKHLGVDATWKMQEIIRNEGVRELVPAGHHYGDAKLHWRTDDDVRRQCEITNPELLPYLDQCFAVTKALEGIPEIPWEEEVRTPKFEDVRTKVLTVAVERLKEMGLGGDLTYVEWLQREDKVFSACEFYDYVWTLYLLTKQVQDEGIPIGYARGSGGGCLIMFLLGIIRVDPVKYGLFFDRFLNPARLGLDPVTLQKVGPISSYPDVDLDFSSIHRKRVIDIARELFGSDKVVPVGTIGEAKAKTAFQDLCRVAQISTADFMPVSKEIPEDPSKETTFDEAIAIPTIEEFCNQNPVIGKFWDQLIGIMRSTGQHAGGVCIADVPIADAIPVVRAGKDGGEIVTGFGESGAVRALESIGFIKFDCLATDTVDHVSLCATNLYEDHLRRGGDAWVGEGERFLYPEQIPSFTMDDQTVMRSIFHTGNTDGIFQFEEDVGKQLATLIRPDTVLEVSDISTMIRPGCLQAPCAYTKPGLDAQQAPTRVEGQGLHFLYAATKFNPELNPAPDGIPAELLEILAPSHYCCIYQEQMMFLIERLTDGQMSLGQGDLYRRRIEHMGKNKPGAKEDVEKLEAEMREKSPYPPEVVERVTTIIKGGANYSFNKSHSLSYSLFSYCQAWFKHYYPHIFYASHVTLLAEKGSKLDKVHKLINNARAQGITITSPHVRHSGDKATWSDDGRTVYLPFTVMKGLKGGASRAIMEISKDVADLGTFLKRAIQHPEITKSHVLALARVGALDDMGYDRIKTLAVCTYFFKCCTARTREKAMDEALAFCDGFAVAGVPPQERLTQWEVNGFGGFINHCPLTERTEQQLAPLGWKPLSHLEPLGEEHDQCVYFLVTSIQKKVHKSGNSKGKEWFKLQCWDGEDVCSLSIWAYDLDDQFNDEGGLKRKGYRPIIKEHQIYKAIVRWDGDRPASLASRSAQRFGEARESLLVHTEDI